MPFFNPSSGGSVEGQPINPSSIGETTRGVGKFTEVWVHAEDTVALLKADSGDTWRMLIGSHIALSANSDNFGIGGVLGIGSEGHAPQVFLTYDAANTLAQRNGTNAQESRLYGTYTSSTVYERLSSKYDSGSGAFVIGTEKGSGGGSARPLWVRIDGTDRLKFNTDGSANYVGSFSASSTISATIISAGYYVKSAPRIFSDLDVAATAGEGARAFITDSNLSYNSLNIGSAVAGGGANSTPVIVIGGAWVVG